MNIELNPKGVFKALICFIFFLLFLNILGLISKHYFGYDTIHGLIPLIDFDTEMNIPTFYSAIAILLSSLLLALIAFEHKSQCAPYVAWLVMAIIFLFLSIDEIGSIHERLMGMMRKTLDARGLFYFAWVIPYGVGLLLFVLAYLRFLIRLPKNIMILFVVSGATYVAGAVGLELFGGLQAETHGWNNLTYSVLYTCEELLEMLGIAIFIYTLLTYITTEFKGITLTLGKSE